jgi:hypothetical protein
MRVTCSEHRMSRQHTRRIRREPEIIRLSFFILHPILWQGRDISGDDPRLDFAQLRDQLITEVPGGQADRII